MFQNPFSPIFGGKPDVFFGRSEILCRFDLAMIDQGSDDKALFFTGTRGSGKTALLEQLSVRARKKGRRVVDLGPEDMISQLLSELSGFDESSTTVSPQANVSLFGIGGGIGGISIGSVSKTRHIGRENLQSLVIEACEKAKHGLLVTVDEIQKVDMDDISSLCNAFQMASRKGLDIMLAVAGLPYCHAKIIEHEGCTYLRRAAHEEIGLFTWQEAQEALADVFSRIRGLDIRENFINQLNQVSFGHPYLMQLLGYHLIVQVNQRDSGAPHSVTESEMGEAISNALTAYENRALKPLLSELSGSERNYLRAMSVSLNDDRLASASKIADFLHKPQNQLSRSRAQLIDQGIIAAPERGKVMFCIPYLADYVQKDSTKSNTVEVARMRRV